LKDIGTTTTTMSYTQLDLSLFEELPLNLIANEFIFVNEDHDAGFLDFDMNEIVGQTSNYQYELNDPITQFCMSLSELPDTNMEQQFQFNGDETKQLPFYLEPEVFFQAESLNKNILDMNSNEFKSFVQLSAPEIDSEEAIELVVEAKDKLGSMFREKCNQMETLIDAFNSLRVSDKSTTARAVAISKVNNSKESMRVSCHARMVSFIEKVKDIQVKPSPTGGKSRNKHFPREARSILYQWFIDHADSPYPTQGEKEALAIQTNLTVKQVNAWFVNKRTRELKKEQAKTK
jgi:hypothetical protein